ncbi:Fumarate and nitrate reduction regulatory protein [Cupriavidus pinatubonensis]|uniref:Fumarate and nitrate reduction regulatory protein n=2 Tax=Cupriavidus pinatubonensis TaxID=248026 RepID=A0ABN7ZUG6_9BURK|nr:Fumarate and nitrate reduction regulatory protein [Cupriavidus pinatubonensis]
MFSAEIVRESRQMMLLGNASAEQRVAAFLLSVSARYRERGYSATSFVLRMTREDIGSFLGVTLETVSRTLSKFQQEGLLTVQGKSIELLNLDALDAR